MILFKGMRNVILIFLFFICISCVPLHCDTSCTDEEITQRVQDLIMADRCLSYQDIDIYTYEQVVTMEGSVESPTQASIALALARSVPRVKCVKMKFKIKNKFNG